MDRSQLRRVVTDDNAKRLAFKAKLAEKIDAVQEETPAPISVGLIIGETFVHPGLGEGTLVSINEAANELVMDFVNKGHLSFVYSKVKNLLAPVKVTVAVPAEHFFGEVIDRTPQLPVKAPGTTDVASVKAASIKTAAKSFTPVPKDEAFSVGERVSHPSLGFGTIISIDVKANEIILDFVGKGQTSLVYSQVRPVLAPVNVEPLVRGDAFIGGTIDRDFKRVKTPGTTDVAAVKAKSSAPDNITVGPPSAKMLIPVGSAVWHPDLGACTVFSVDKAQNSITLEFPTGKMDFVLNQVESKLAPVTGGAPDHVAPNRAPAPVVSSPVQIPTQHFDVALPSVFQTWLSLKQYGYLTTERHLTADQANDIIDMVNGKPIRTKKTSYSLTWDDSIDDAKRFAVEQDLAHRREAAKVTPVPSKPQVDATPEPVREVAKLSISLPTAFKQWSLTDRHTFLTKTKRLTPGEANDVLAVYSGSTPRSQTQFEITWDEDREVARVFAEAAAPEPVSVAPRLAVQLPMVLKTWKPVDQFSFLTTTKHLTSDQANNVLAGIDCGVDVSWVDDVPDREKRQAHKQNLLKAVEAAASRPVVTAPIPAVAPVEPAINGISSLSVAVPSAFRQWSVADQYTFLTKTKRLTSNEANDLIDLFNGLPARDARTTYEFLWDSEADVQRVMTEKPVVAAPITKPQSLSVNIPMVFKTWKPSDQFSYLVGKKLTSDQANDLLAMLAGKSSRNNFDIHWEEIADSDKRANYKTFLARRIENGLKVITPSVAPAPVDTGVSRVVEDIEIITKVAELRKLSVKMPTVFKDWNQTGQYVYLTRTKQLTPDEANDIMALSVGESPRNSKINYEIVWSE